MSLDEMSAATGIEKERIKDLESYGIVCSHGPESAIYYDGDDYIVLSIVKDFFRYGVEPRHLTMYKHFEEREAAFFETIVAPMMRQKNPDARRAASAVARRAREDLAEVQAGAAADQHPRPPPERLSVRVAAAAGHRGRSLGASWRSPFAVGARRRRARDRSRRPRRCRPLGEPSPFVTDLRTPAPPAAAARDRRGLRDPGRPRLGTGPVPAGAGPAERPIASVTKIMTALLVLERAQLDDVVTVSADATFPPDFAGPSALGLRAGERISVQELLYALLLQSANDAAVALAEHVSGTEERFVAAMNVRARRARDGRHAGSARPTASTTAATPAHATS